MNGNLNSLIEQLASRLKSVSGVKAVVLGGSRADDSERLDSDADLGIYYENQNKFDLYAIRELATQVNDTPNPIVTSIDEWGKWVNGGAWLTIKGQRVDFLYRDLNFVKQIIQDCKNGIIQSDFYQQPPYGFHSFIYCAEIQTCKILFDLENAITNLKLEVKEYPKPLRKAIINGFLWDAEFSLSHCKKSAERGEVLIVAGCLTRIAGDLIQVLYALNNTYFIGVKKFYRQEPVFELKINNFSTRINQILGYIGNSITEMNKTVAYTEQLFEDLIKIAESEYSPKFENK
jgi:predicted nucleotidyltransferase